MEKELYMIVAVDRKNGMGKAGKLPWNLKGDMKHFKKITLEVSNSAKQNALIMGRNTWESIPMKFRPLPGRKNIVLTRNEKYNAPGASIFSSFNEALKELNEDNTIAKIFIIGGSEIFKQLLGEPRLNGIYLTKIFETFDCDVFFPDTSKYFPLEKLLGKDEENGVKFEYFLCTRA